MTTTRRAIIVGATSGIGEALARVMAAEGWTLGLAGRRTSLLDKLRAELPGDPKTRCIDVADTPACRAELLALIEEMGGVDVVVVNAGFGLANPPLDWEIDRETIAVNVTGFTAIATAAFAWFKEHGGGCLVGVSSVAAVRGARGTCSYNASKAFVSNFLEGLRHTAAKRRLPITVLEIRPGFVDTAMTKANKGMFWVATPETAARQILAAIEAKKSRVYVTRRWRIMACLLRLLPDFLYHRT